MTLFCDITLAGRIELAEAQFIAACGDQVEVTSRAPDSLTAEALDRTSMASGEAAQRVSGGGGNVGGGGVW